MWEKIHWWAFALLDWKNSNSLKISMTILWGSNKQNIEIEQHKMSNILLEDENLPSKLKQEISDFVTDLLNIGEEGSEIHITCGSAESMNSLPIIKRLDVGIWLWSFDERSYPMLLQSVISDLFHEATLPRENISINARGFYPADYAKKILKSENQWKLLQQDWLAQFRIICKEISADIIKVIQAKKNISDNLREGVQALAEHFANKRKKASESLWSYGSPRFISLSEEQDVRNLILIVPELREIFWTFFLEEFWRENNICMKAYWEKSNPPFSDVEATYIADRLDSRSGTLSALIPMKTWERERLTQDVIQKNTFWKRLFK